MTAPPQNPPGFSTYLAKDYASFRALMLDHLTGELPELANLEVASVEMTLVEALAYVGDYLSQYQDAVGSEAYVQTARLWTSLSRHARLVGLRLSEGCSARTLVRFEAAGDHVPVAKGTALLAAQPGIDRVHLAKAAPFAGAIGFETLHDLTLQRAHNRIALAPVSRPAPGFTGLTLDGHFPLLQPGHFLVLCEEDSGWRWPLRLIAPDCDPAGRSTITWHELDALPADTPRQGTWCLLGNLALADHGLTLQDPQPIAHPAANARPLLHCPDLSFAVPLGAGDATRSAAHLLAPDPLHALPALWLDERIAPLAADVGAWPIAQWRARRDLLDAAPQDLAFVPERVDKHSYRLRFGDGHAGRRPQSDYEFHSSWRQGCGSAGNIGIDALAHVIAADGRIRSVGNPLPGSGGRDRPALSVARQALIAEAARCPQARCVTEADYARHAARLHGVKASACRIVPRAGGRDVTITVQRDHGSAANIASALEPYRLLGDRLAIEIGEEQ
ncbi:MAG: hypothetical protein C0515_00725 [Novosphingobium sp.]|nr:hypothetical protein [Novosphingobium sp.]MBX9644699.1 hypothetical protein [Novosphingobium sp.]